MRRGAWNSHLQILIGCYIPLPIQFAPCMHGNQRTNFILESEFAETLLHALRNWDSCKALARQMAGQ